ncbi:MAG: fused MFS/spermidine synthase [Dethiobacter sp.]|nr:fused MFS/spermidine synthase [Dethiobacter sp.]MBS3901137.1 fused MFS/spermidine synthase [Dethiobacter sp.]
MLLHKNIRPPYPAVLMLGVVSQIAQVLFLRELLMVFHGNELSIGIILAVWLAWVGAGSHLGSFLSVRSKNPFRLLILCTAGILPLLPATIWLIRGLRRFFNVLPGAYLTLTDMALSAFLVLAPACLLFGIQFVLLSRLWRERSAAGDTSAAGKTYLAEAAGNMLGGLAFTFLLVHYLNSFQATFMAGLLLLAAVLSVSSKAVTPAFRRMRPNQLLLWILPLAAAVTFPFLQQLNQQAYRMKWHYFTPLHQLVETSQSRHGTIAVLLSQDQYTFFQSGHLLFSTAGPLAPAPEFEKQEAVHFAHLAMTQHPAPRSILLLGGGLRGTLSEMLRYPLERIDYIELDPALTGVARPYLSAASLAALGDKRVRLLHTDARLFVKTARELYDMIIVDLPDPVTAVWNRYYTSEFFREAAALLRPGGVLVLTASSTPDLRGLAVANRNTTIFHTLSAEFSRVLVAGERSMLFIATDTHEQISVDAATLEERFRKLGITADGFSPQHFHTLLPEVQLQQVNWTVRQHGRGSGAQLSGPPALPLLLPSLTALEQMSKELPPIQQRYFINSDFRPIAYFYTMMFWDELTRPGGGEIFRWLLRLHPGWFLSFALIPFLGFAVWRAGSRRTDRNIAGFSVLFTAFATGLSAMSLQIAMLFSFQSIYGFVYEMIGLIMAVFMGGLTLGSFLTHRYVADKNRPTLLAASQAAIALLAITIAAVLPDVAALQPLALVPVIFYALTFAAGLANGISFPLSAACYLALNKQPERATGAVYGSELLGACLGAVLAGAVVAPVLGIVASCLLAAAAALTALALLLITRRFVKCQRTGCPSV